MKFYYLHIPKNAGSSALSLFKDLSEDKICRARNWDQLLLEDPAKRQEAAVFAGHFGARLDEFLGEPLRTVVMLRDPTSRTISHYLHVKRDSNHPFHSYVQAQSLEAFLRDPVTAPMTYNFQARYLTRLGIAPWKLARRLRREDLLLSRLSVTWELALYGLDESELQEGAIDTLENCSYVGIVDQFDKAVCAVMQFLAPLNLSLPQTLNVAPQPYGENLSESSLELIASQTRIDQVLYDLARIKASGA